jgi:hypothetical protein
MNRTDAAQAGANGPIMAPDVAGSGACDLKPLA